MIESLDASNAHQLAQIAKEAGALEKDAVLSAFTAYPAAAASQPWGSKALGLALFWADPTLGDHPAQV